ncbi:MAG: RQC domain-containing protein, partial [Patescibacteria group bacterium]
ECMLFYSYGDMAKHYRFMKDVTDLEEKKHAEEKLKQIVAYAELSACRRQFLLAYFHEEFNAPCGACDNCLHTTETVDATEIAQKILSAILRTGQRYGGGYIADVLTGKDDEKVITRGHNNLSVFGIAADMKKKHITRIINAICAQGLITQQGEEYPIYVLTQRGKQFLNNKETLALSAHVMSRPKGSGGRIELDDSTPTDFYLFEKLRALRTKLAEERNVPPYIIFGDRTLKEMSQRVPKNKDELSQIFGVGSQKLEWFGDLFLEAIRGYAGGGK